MSLFTRFRKTALWVVVLMAIGSAAMARNTYIYFESIVNCDDGGGWVVISENEDGSGSIDVLCDGG